MALLPDALQPGGSPLPSPLQPPRWPLWGPSARLLNSSFLPLTWKNLSRGLGSLPFPLWSRLGRCHAPSRRSAPQPAESSNAQLRPAPWRRRQTGLRGTAILTRRKSGSRPGSRGPRDSSFSTACARSSREGPGKTRGPQTLQDLTRHVEAPCVWMCLARGWGKRSAKSSERWLHNCPQYHVTCKAERVLTRLRPGWRLSGQAQAMPCSARRSVGWRLGSILTNPMNSSLINTFLGVPPNFLLSTEVISWPTINFFSVHVIPASQSLPVSS